MWESPIGWACVASGLAFGCQPSAAELAERAAKEDAAAMARAHTANAARVSKAAAEASAVAAHDARAGKPDTATGGCGITAERAIARMGKCGLNVDGFTPEMLCKKMGQPKLLYLASRDCSELESLILGSE